MSIRPLLTLACLTCFASTASAQIFYEPLQSQYTCNGQTYSYGGNDPQMFAYARWSASFMQWTRSSAQPRVGGNVDHFQKVNPRVYVYSDVLPNHNAADYGYTRTDAENQANANVPLYFRKANLVAAAVPIPGGMAVPAQAQPVPVAPPATQPTARPSTRPAAIIIIPFHRKPQQVASQAP